jgi:alpha-mannosidase
MRALSTGLHNGILPPSMSFVAVEPAAFLISAIKQSEDLRGWLVRGYNLTGEAITVTLKPWKPYKTVELVNLAEQKLVSLKPEQNGAISFKARGHEIVTVLFINKGL